MLSRAGFLPRGAGWVFEPKWDGFRAIVSTVDGLSVRSRRGWQMAQRVPELEALPDGLVLDGELVAFAGGDPWFPHVGDRILHGRDLPIVYMAFDVLYADGEGLLKQPLRARRRRLDALSLPSDVCQISPAFDDGESLMVTIVDRGWEGVVAKKLAGTYRPGRRDWIKVKNRGYWRYEQERELARTFRSRSPFAAEAF
jgi:bifunctional non-homologous end joining protein LigD